MDEEIIENWRLMKQAKQERHAQWKAENTAILEKEMPGRYRSTNNGENLIFREQKDGYPMVNFFPSTGRWIIPNRSKRRFGGGARKFVKWYEAQKQNQGD